MLKRSLIIFVAFLGVFLASAGLNQAKASVLKNAYVALSNPIHSLSAQVNHDFYFTTVNNSLGSVKFQYCVAPSGTCSDTGGGGAAGALASVLKAGVGDAGWTAAWSGTTMSVTKSAVDAAAGDVAYKFAFTSMSNPTLGNCNFTSNATTGTCYIRINSYTDTNYSSAADDAIVSMTVTQSVSVTARVDPVFTLQIEGVGGVGQTLNGTVITNNLTTTTTTIPFGNLTVGTAKYASQKLTVTTNAVNGYVITTKLNGTNLTGSSYGHDIDPFAATNAASTNAVAWSSPNGTASGTNSGWIGVGTDDTGVAGRASNSFFPLNTDVLLVAKSTNSASSRISNLVYAIEINAYQQSDNYTGTVFYNATTTY